MVPKPIFISTILATAHAAPLQTTSAGVETILPGNAGDAHTSPVAAFWAGAGTATTLAIATAFAFKGIKRWVSHHPVFSSLSQKGTVPPEQSAPKTKGFSGQASLFGDPLRNRDILKERDPEPNAPKSDLRKHLPEPPAQKALPPNALIIDLPKPELPECDQTRLVDAIANRSSHRKFSHAPLSLSELSFLLWATQGLKEKNLGKYSRHFRMAPSAGGLHPLETYLLVHNVTGLAEGFYRYLPFEHKLCALAPTAQPIPGYTNAMQVEQAALGQRFVGMGAATFIWTAIPYRTEWKYGPRAAKFIALDAGHVCQNLYLAVEAIGCGTCAVAAYNQKLMDTLVGVDGTDEFVVYLAPVGKV